MLDARGKAAVGARVFVDVGADKVSPLALRPVGVTDASGKIVLNDGDQGPASACPRRSATPCVDRNARRRPALVRALLRGLRDGLGGKLVLPYLPANVRPRRVQRNDVSRLATTVPRSLRSGTPCLRDLWRPRDEPSTKSLRFHLSSRQSLRAALPPRDRQQARATLTPTPENRVGSLLPLLARRL